MKDRRKQSTARHAREAVKRGVMVQGTGTANTRGKGGEIPEVKSVDGRDVIGVWFPGRWMSYGSCKLPPDEGTRGVVMHGEGVARAGDGGHVR